MKRIALILGILFCVAPLARAVRTDPCKASLPANNYCHNLSIGNGWTIWQGIGQTLDVSEGTNTSVTLPYNPQIGDTVVIGNGQCSYTAAGCTPGTYTPGAVYNGDGLGNVAQGTVSTQGQVVTLTYGNGFGVQGCKYSGGCLWAGKPISIGGANYTIQTVLNLTTLTLTSSAGNQTNVPYIGPAPGCIETGSVNVAVQSTCWYYVSQTGTDNVSVYGPNNYSLSESIAEFQPPSGHPGPLSIDVAGCPIQSCGQIFETTGTTSPSNALSQGITDNANELVWIQGEMGAGPVWQESGWTPIIMGTNGATHSDNTCDATGFCENEAQVEVQTFASAQAVAGELMDGATEDATNIVWLAFAPGDTPANDTPGVYLANESCGYASNPNYCGAPNVPLSFAVPLTNPSVLAVCATYTTAAGSITPGDSAGNNFIDVGPGPVPYEGGPPYTQCWYAENKSNQLEDAISWTGGTPYTAIAGEFVGLKTSSVVDAYGSNPNVTTSSTGVSTGSLTTTVVNDLVLGTYFPSSGPPSSVGSGYTALMQGMFSDGALFYKIYTATGAVNPSATNGYSGTYQYGGESIAFKNATVPNTFTALSVIVFGVP